LLISALPSTQFNDHKSTIDNESTIKDHEIQKRID